MSGFNNSILEQLKAAPRWQRWFIIGVFATGGPIFVYEHFGTFWFWVIAVVFGMALLNHFRQWRAQRQSVQEKEAFDRQYAALAAEHDAQQAVLAAADPQPQRGYEQRQYAGREVVFDWHERLHDAAQAWNAGDFDATRRHLQKLSYVLTNEKASPELHGQFKALVARFCEDDPLYKQITAFAFPAIEQEPGIVQSKLMKRLPQFSPDEFRYAMYYAEVRGELMRTKKGSSYALTLTGRHTESK